MKTDKQIFLKFVNHRSAKNIVLSFLKFDYPKLTLKQILNENTKFEFNGNKKSRKVTELIKEIENNSFWGYCSIYNKGKRAVHYWIANKGVTRQDLMDLFAHELAHAIGYKSEKHASNIGTVSAYAYDIVKSLEKKRHKRFAELLPRKKK